MTGPQASINKFFVSSDFALYYRKAKQFQSLNQVNSNYGLIFVLAGQLDCVIGDSVVELRDSESLITQPNTRIDARGKPVEFLYLTLAPAIVVEHAIAMHLSAPQSTVTFIGQKIENDKRLTDL